MVMQPIAEDTILWEPSEAFRSQATMSRLGVRMGSSEFYSVVENLPDILDNLVVEFETIEFSFER